RHRGARLADISADPRASGRPRRERRPPARGDDPDRGGESGGDVARAARPDREGGGRSRDPSRRSGRAVRGRPGGGRNDDARRSGHAPKRAARPLGTRMGAARGQAPEEALRAGRLLAATAAALAGIALLPAVAHNFFVPRQLVLTSSTAALGHSYWESRFETHLGDAYAKEAKELILQDHTPSDTHLDTIISPTLFSVRTSRRLFRGMVHLTES